MTGLSRVERRVWPVHFVAHWLAALVALIFTSQSVRGQTARLPPVDPLSEIYRLPPVIPQDKAIFERPAESLAMLPPSADETQFFNDPRDPNLAYELLEPDEQNAVLNPAPPTGWKSGFWQWSTFRATYLFRGNHETGFGMTDLLVQQTVALPFFTRKKPILITPYFQPHLLDGPVQADMPPEIYDVSLEFRILRQVTPKFGMDLAFAPSILSDFHNMTHDAYRFTGRAAGLYTITERFKVAAGVLYLDRDDVRILPVGGAIWTPSDPWRIEAIFPKPRVARKIFENSQADGWFYAAGEFGGNSYAIERSNGTDDVVTYKDLRAMLGVERKARSGAYNRFEVGYVFDRSLTYTSNTPTYRPSDTVMLRAETMF